MVTACTSYHYPDTRPNRPSCTHKIIEHGGGGGGGVSRPTLFNRFSTVNSLLSICPHPQHCVLSLRQNVRWCSHHWSWHLCTTRSLNFPLSFIIALTNPLSSTQSISRLSKQLLFSLSEPSTLDPRHPPRNLPEVRLDPLGHIMIPPIHPTFPLTIS